MRPSTPPVSRAIALAIALLASSTALGAMYRWVDESGSVIYSQSPPPDGRDATAVRPPPPPPEPPEAARQRLDERLKAADEARKSQAEQQKKEAETRSRDADKRKNCDAARRNLELIENRPPQSRFQTPDGDVRRYTDEDRAAELKKLREFLEKNCR
jgi:hypothetical protein